MCQMCCGVGGGGGGGRVPYFPEYDNQVFGAGFRFGGGCPVFFTKIGHQGLVLGTNLGWWCQHLWVHGK